MAAGTAVAAIPGYQTTDGKIDFDFVPVPNFIALDPTFHDAEVRLLAVLLSYDHKSEATGVRKGWVNPSQSTLAKDTRSTRDTVARRLRSLADRGVVRLEEQIGEAHRIVFTFGNLRDSKGRPHARSQGQGLRVLKGRSHAASEGQVADDLHDPKGSYLRDSEGTNREQIETVSVGAPDSENGQADADLAYHEVYEAAVLTEAESPNRVEFDRLIATYGPERVIRQARALPARVEQSRRPVEKPMALLRSSIIGDYAMPKAGANDRLDEYLRTF